VLSARDRNSPNSDAALETLCRTYWFPLYAFIRRLGHSPHDAQDFPQEFFARLLQKEYLNAAASEPVL
jgi:RNA polymerase sigma-70 factor (ECF subfamily)